MQNDPLNDAMSVMKNASSIGKGECIIQPSSKLIGRVLKVMQDNGYVNQFEYIEDGKAGKFRVMMKGAINDCGVIKPRYSVKVAELEKYEARFLPAQNFGVLILSTTEGVVTHTRAKELGIGGKLLAYVYQRRYNMTIAGKIESTIAIPSGVTVSKDGSVVRVKGPKGELSRNFAHPSVIVNVEGDSVSVSCEYPRIKEKAMVGTFHAHLRNMIHGVTEGYTYQLKTVFSHFPMKVAVKGDKVQIDNYMGGHAPRFANILEGVTVKVSGADITVTGADIEKVGQTAANLEKATSRGGFDKRVFQDGIYIVHKSHKVKE